MLQLFQLFAWWIYVTLLTLNCGLLNQYESDGSNYWASLTPFIPIKNATYGKIQIKPKMFFQFEIYWYNLVENGTDHENIFRIGNNGIDRFGCNQHAHRYPALYINKYTKRLQVGISDTDDCWGNHYQSIDFTFTENTSYKFLMEFTDSTLVILVNGIPIYNGNRPGTTPNHTLWSFVDVIISDPLNTAAHCIITDFLILSYETNKSMYPTPSPTQFLSFTPTSYPTQNTILPTEYDMYSVDIAITLNYNSSLMNIDENEMIEINDIISTLIQNNNDIDVSQLAVSTKHNIETHQLIINVVYNTLNEFEAHTLSNYILNNLSEQLLDELDHRFKIILIDVTGNDTNINEQESDSNSSRDTKILWIFNQQTIWYLIFGTLGAFIIVIIGCCILCYRYHALIKKARNREKAGIDHDRSRHRSPPQIQIAKEGEYKYDEDDCLMLQQLDIGSSPSTIKSPQYSVSNMRSVVVVDGIDQRRCIKIIQPQYYNDNIDGIDYLDNDHGNSSSNESMYNHDHNLSVTETTRTATNHGHETIL